ncbi:hypothetical protein F7734_40355 [Scytonema sp. UIC 10036]|uniref:hypothetical protein n=1 Tax=Scytonema sp. UIC 10036 TaxID=2304196 RepID=UPI0012DA90F9|nr:hypothetical protein [Scytonema sp. UIC 10036]MUG98233.1 hypothetical protein [Scytonema sp. UIC 10036]
MGRTSRTFKITRFSLGSRNCSFSSLTASGLEALQALDRFIPDVLVSDVGKAEMDGYMLMP